MKHNILVLLSILSILNFSCNNKREGTPKVLVFSKTAGYKHKSISKGVEALQKLGKENGFEVDTTINAVSFSDDNLKKYSSVIFLNTTGNILNHYQEAAFERYIQAGGGFVGIHAATDTEYDWGWYTKLVGAQFKSHPSGTPEADYSIVDDNFGLDEGKWHKADEIYNLKRINEKVNVVVTVDENSYSGGENGENHPISWYHEYDGGRAFYTALGHTDESYEDAKFLNHILAGIKYAIGENQNLDYTKALSQIPPDMDRFSKVNLKVGAFFEPTEMTILPNNDVLVAQRRGEILYYNHLSKEIKEVAFLDVYFKANVKGVNAEEGLMGLQKDPNYAENNWVYVFYSPSGDTWVNRLSRFKFKEGVFDLNSEQIILDVDSQREICCHTGGSIAFDSNGLLYLSTGDNATPFNQKGVKYTNRGFAPLNNVEGSEQYDARRSSGNTNDLRGKIIRIKVNKDGSYTIPEGNLFPEGTANTRPEIYTMGHRNPYRISVDQKNGYVYWGDVGPDSRKDEFDTRGPKGYDEMNQAKEAGNFGWPFFIADNKPYREYNYATGEHGDAFDPEKPMNTSKNNTGLKELPKAIPAYAYYPYVDSGEFPQVGSGGRNAMAGPVYYSDLYDGKNNLPSYYDGKVIVYDWIRGWMKAVTFFKDGNFNKMEPFASDIQVNSLIDMEVGPDGKIYLLEYGKGWFSKNPDAALSYISFNGGNRAPIINNFEVDKTSGKTPLVVSAKVDAMDREDDVLTYEWNLGNGVVKKTTEPQISFTYDEVGDYKVSVVVNDGKGESVESATYHIVSGNTLPNVTINIIDGDITSFVPGEAISYEVVVTDSDEETIDASNIFVSVDYLEGMDKVAMSMGHQQVSETVIGKSLTQSMDCKACHKESEPSLGPSYIEVAEKYKNDSNFMKYIQNKIATGGAGVWGEVVMPAHPNITTSESRQIATYIASLTGEDKKPSLPVKGIIVPEKVEKGNTMVITASYTDNGSNGAIPLTSTKVVALSQKDDTE